MALKVHIICAKCGSDRMTFVINKPCPDDPDNVASLQCLNCSELTGIDEWCEANNRILEKS